MKIKIFKIIAIVFLIFAAVNIVGGFFLGLSIFSKSFKSDSNLKSDNYVTVEDTVYLHKQKIAKCQEKLDSLLKINPLQAELFADKLIEKYKNEIIFLEYKAFASFKQKKYNDALKLYKIINNPLSEFLGTKINNNRNIALCFENLREYDSAIYYFKISSIDGNLNGIARCFESKKELDSAMYFYKSLLNKIKNEENVNYSTEDLDYLKLKIDSISKLQPEKKQIKVEILME